MDMTVSDEDKKALVVTVGTSVLKVWFGLVWSSIPHHKVNLVFPRASTGREVK